MEKIVRTTALLEDSVGGFEKAVKESYFDAIGETMYKW